MMDKSFICVSGQEIHVNTYEEIYISYRDPRELMLHSREREMKVIDLSGIRAGCVRFGHRGAVQKKASWGRLGAASYLCTGGHPQSAYRRRGPEFS